jgi:clan AA aspartic protease
MIEGIISNMQACVPVGVSSHTGRPMRISAVVDTGYNGSLALPSQIIARLSLRFAGHRTGKLADGSSILLTMYSAFVEWHGRSKFVVIADGAAAPLIGMALISGSRLTIDAIEDGSVLIEELL